MFSQSSSGIKKRKSPSYLWMAVATLLLSALLLNACDAANVSNNGNNNGVGNGNNGSCNGVNNCNSYGGGQNTSTQSPANLPPTPTPTMEPVQHNGETLVIHAEGEQFVAQATTDYRFSYRGGAYSIYPCDSQPSDWTTALRISGSVTDTWFDLGHFSSWDQAQAKVYGPASVHTVHLNQGDAISLTPAENAQCFGSYGAETVDVNW